MDAIQVNLCVYCETLVFKVTASTGIQHWASLELLRGSSGSCHSCSTLHDVLSQISSKARARFAISNQISHSFPLTISCTASQDLAGGVRSKAVTATLDILNGFSYSSKMTIAWCLPNCKALILSKSPAHRLTHFVSAYASKSPSWQHLPTSPASRVTHIRHWLRRCEQNHPACTSGPQTALPNRLIDLLPDDKSETSDQMCAKLVFAKDVTERH
jgi:hypothetical protein